MDVHRCRFVPYPPSRINALAFSQTSGYKTSYGKSSTTLRLAIGRGNGDIEIWNPLNGAWHHEITCRGGKDRSIDSLVWIQEPDEHDDNGYVHVGRLRLFSSGHSSAVTEWDLLTGLPLRHSSGSHSEVWSLCAQPPWQPPKQHLQEGSNFTAREGEFRGQNIVAGCADGTLALLSTADDDLRFEKYVSRSSKRKARALSVAFQTRDIVVAGYADSTVRVYDTRNGTLLRNMSLGIGPKGGPKEILVWDVKCLPNGNIVSADSTGEVRFWDGKNYAQLQRIKGHETDAVALVTSADGETIFSGGLDRRTVVYRLTGREGTKRRWANFAHKRMHKHDISAMSAFDSGKMSIVVSGGVDAAPIIFPLREYGNENHRALPNLPQQSITISAPKARLLVSWWDREVYIWRINEQRSDPDSDDDSPAPRGPEDRRLLGRIALKGEENISSVSISDDGKLLVVSTAAELKLFQLRLKIKADGHLMRVRKLEIGHQILKTGAKLVRISPDGKWLAKISHDNGIAMARFTSAQDNERNIEITSDISKLRRVHRKPAKQNGLNGIWGSYDRTVTHAAFSADSKIFVTAEISGHIDSWILKVNGDVTAAEDAPKLNGTSTSTTSDSQCESESESDTSDDSSDAAARKPAQAVMAQSWVRSSSANMLPKLPSAPLILAFKPSHHTTSHSPFDHGNTMNASIKHDQLLAVTAQHQLYEFNVLEGKLSDWSRRNPTSNLPEDFKVERDRAMGCVWDVLPGRERVWLYGCTWLFMLDMSQDLQRDVEDVERRSKGGEVAGNGGGNTGKRKREGEVEEVKERKRLRTGTSGAGSRVPDRERSGIGTEIRKVVGGEDEAGQRTLLDRPQLRSVDDEDEDVDAYDDDDFAVPLNNRLLKDLSDGEDQKAVTNGVHNNHTINTHNNIQHNTRPKTKVTPGWWMTHKYRPILGIVPLSSENNDLHDMQQNAAENGHEEEVEDDAEAPSASRKQITKLQQNEARPIEVALVERPPWDVDLPPRFEGLHDVED